MSVAVAVLLGLGLTCTPARADNPFITRKPVYNWNGLWWGGHLGAEWGELIAEPASGTGYEDARFSGGIGLGYDREFSRVVFGVSADTDFASWSAGGRMYLPAVSPSLLSPQLTVRSEMEWFTTVRARIGVRFDRALPYITGGLALAKITTSAQSVATTGPFAFAPVTSDSWEAGYTIGAGLEYRLTEHDTLGVEYLYYQIQGPDLVVVPQNWRLDNKIRGHIVRATFKYTF